nr:ABC transporter ATP-binding protein [uncultured Clostridium sp.]
MGNLNIEKQKWKPFFKLLLQSKLPWKWYILNLILALALNTAAVKLPQVAGDIMQGNIFNQQLVMKYVVVTIVLTILGSSLGLFGTWVDLNTDRNLEKAVWRKIIRMPVPFYASLNPSSLTSRVTSDAASVSYGLSGFFNSINVIYTLVITLITVYHMSHKMVIAMAVLIPWVLIVTILPGRFICRASNMIQSTYSIFTNYITERLNNLQLIKSSAAEDFEVEQGIKVAKEQYNAEIYSAKISLISEPFTYSIEAFCKALVLIYGGILISQKQLQMGQLIAMFMYVDTITISVISCISCYQSLKEAQGSTQKISEIIQSESEKVERKCSLTLHHEDIKFHEVSFRYKQKNIFTNLNFTIPKLKVTAIVGPSGSGKTTILNMLERFYIPETGQVKYGDIPMEDINLDEWRNAIGYVPQNSPLLSGTIWDNIVYGVNHNVEEEEVIHAAKLANAYDFIQALPKGFHTDIGEHGSKLSGGERQRIAIARTVLKNPDYLLLDEATCSLDAKNEQEVQIALNCLMKGRTTIIVAHNLKTVVNADNIIVLDQGEIKAIGQHDMLYKECKLYRRYFDLQFN